MKKIYKKLKQDSMSAEYLPGTPYERNQVRYTIVVDMSEDVFTDYNKDIYCEVDEPETVDEYIELYKIDEDKLLEWLKENYKG